MPRLPALIRPNALLSSALRSVLVWFFGFMVIGGEWFSMWQSPTWNGQQAAFRFYLTILAVLVFVNQADGDLAERPPP
jgi:predicted small integral membrane protein